MNAGTDRQGGEPRGGGAPGGPPGGYGLDLPPGVELPREPGMAPADPLALTSLLLGLGSLLSVACCSFLSPLAALGAIVTGAVALLRVRATARSGWGLAVTGIVLGSLDLLATVTWLAWWLHESL